MCQTLNITLAVLTFSFRYIILYYVRKIKVLKNLPCLSVYVV